jgi:hypothetical protein
MSNDKAEQKALEAEHGGMLKAWNILREFDPFARARIVNWLGSMHKEQETKEMVSMERQRELAGPAGPMLVK